MSENVYTLLPYDDDANAQAQASQLKVKLISDGIADQLPPWGRLWIKAGKVVCVMPSHPIHEFDAPSILFVDESLDEKRRVFFVGGLVFRSLHVIIAVARYIQNLVVLAETHQGFWQRNTAPPRLHLRELNNPSARLRAKWKHVPRQHIEMLFKTLVPSIRELSGLRLVAPIDLSALERSLLKAFPESPVGAQSKQLSLQLASWMLKMMLSDSRLTIDQLEIVADHDDTPINLGKGRRQATLHFLDGLVHGNSLGDGKPALIWNDRARYTSRFPSSLTFDVLETEGFCLRALTECVGLQLIDVYLGLWRIVNAEKRSHFGVGSEDLGVQVVSNMVWV